MDTSEILKNAAKAVGVVGKYFDKCEHYPEWGIFPERGVDHTDYWNSLENDTDAFDIITTCAVSVVQAWNKVEVKKGSVVLWWEYVEEERQRKRLTRLSLTCAAAKLVTKQ